MIEYKASKMNVIKKGDKINFEKYPSTKSCRSSQSITTDCKSGSRNQKTKSGK
jgi:hypothetical protein